MTRKPPELDRRLAVVLVNWYKQHRAIGFRDHNQQFVALRALSPRIVRDYLAAYDAAAEEALSDTEEQRPLRLFLRHLESGSGLTPQKNNPAMDQHEPSDGPLLLAIRGPQRVH